MAQVLQTAGNQDIEAASEPASRLAFESIRHSYHGKETLRDVSLAAEPGEVLCLLGPSGSGKTTLLRIAAGLEAQSHGRIVIDDREVAGPNVFLPPEKRGVGLMFQDFALFPHMTVLDNVRFGLTGLSAKAAAAEATEALARVGLSHYADKYPHALSGGEQQRVALARALAPRPDVLLMDEPFSGLDSRLKEKVRADTLDILKESRATAIVVTHDAEEAMRMADRIALMKDGRLVQVGKPDELYRRPKTLFAAGFFSEINEFGGDVRNGQVLTPFGSVPANDIAEGRAVSVAVRLTDVAVDARDSGVPARIVSRRFIGAAELVLLSLSGAAELIRARIPMGGVPAGINNVFIRVSAEDILVFEKAS